MFHHSPYDATLVRRYFGHTDGLWEITSGSPNSGVVGTASADATARVWDSLSGACLATYREHKGSVNSIRFHPNEPLLCTASGDNSVHVWPVNFEALQRQRYDMDERGELKEAPEPGSPLPDCAKRA